MATADVITLDRPGAAERLTVNKRELARLLKCSLPTLDRLIDDNPDLPIERRGSNGVEWEFDPEAVVGFIADRREAEKQAGAARSELLRQFTLPFEQTEPEGARDLSPSERKNLADALSKERKLAIEAGLLVTTASVRQGLGDAFKLLGRHLDGLPQQLGRRHHLPDAVVREMVAQIADARRQFVRELEALIVEEPDAA